MPEPVLTRIAAAWQVVLTRPSGQDNLCSVGTVQAAEVSPAQTQVLLAREYANYATLVSEAKIRAEG